MNIYKIENIITKDCYIGSETNDNYLGEFKSLSEAQIKTGIPSGSISQSINKNCLAKGYRFKKNTLGGAINIIAS